MLVLIFSFSILLWQQLPAQTLFMTFDSDSIQRICWKAFKLLGFIQCLFHEIKLSIPLETLYCPSVSLISEYSAVIWDPLNLLQVCNNRFTFYTRWISYPPRNYIPVLHSASHSSENGHKQDIMSHSSLKRSPRQSHT